VIRTEPVEGDRVRLSVQDAGTGIEPHNLDKLFDAFYTTKNGGMVIGLSVSRSIIESHHGRLRAARNDGPGATLSLSIPRICEGATGGTPAALSHRAMTAMNGTRPFVAVVDDDESVRESLPDLSKELGFEVQAFSSAEEFLASDSVSRTRCLILDIAMPGMSGPALQREVTRRRYDVPIVYITALGDDAVRARVLNRVPLSAC